MSVNLENPGLDKEIWIAGKGPLLDKYDWSRAGKCRIGINESAFFIPECTHAFSFDINVLTKFQELKCCVIANIQFSHCLNFEKVYWWSFERKYTGSINVFLQLCELMGVQYIHLIAFDSLWEQYHYSPKILKNGFRGTNPDNFKIINNNLREIIINSKMKFELALN